MSKNIIVTGASRGIGRATAASLAKKGHTIVAVARTKSSLDELRDQYPGQVLSSPADLTDPGDVKNVVTTITREFGQLDILVNNAGSLINKSFEDITVDEWTRLINVNLLSAVALTKELLSYLSEDAHIVNISSMGGYQGSAKFPGLSAYSVTKGALSILSECLAVELSDYGIKSNTLCLGAVQTEMFEEAFPGMEAPLTPEEMGNYVADFALNGSTFYNGQILPVASNDPG